MMNAPILSTTVLRKMSFALRGILLFSVFCSSSSSKVKSSLTSENEIALEGFVYKHFQALDLWDCFKKCLVESVCQSINFHLYSLACEFNKDIKRLNPTRTRRRYLGVYMENPKRAKKGTAPLLAARSCKEIIDFGESVGDGQYWIDPEHSGKPFTAFCDMTTDSGGWTLIKRTELDTSSPDTDRLDMNDYRGIANFTNNMVYILVPAIQKLRDVMRFNQIRWRCHKKSLGRTLHIMTTNDSAGHNVLRHFLDEPRLQPTACNSFVRLPDDNSILSQNCLKWGNMGNSQVEVNKWGRYTNNGNHRIYNNVIVWESKHYFTFLPPKYYCDDFTGNYGNIDIGDQWEVFVR